MADFDGSTSYLRRDGNLAGVQDSKLGTFSCWFNFDTSGQYQKLFYLGDLNGNSGVQVQLNNDDKLYVLLRDSSNNTAAYYYSSELSTDTWYHVVASWNTGTPVFQMYINRESDATASVSVNDRTIDYTTAICLVGATGSGGAVTHLFDGSIYDLAFWPGYRIDLSSETNLLQFISSDGFTYTGDLTNGEYANPGPTAGTPKPVGYGPGASRPFGGDVPGCFFSGPFVTNRGKGGAFALNGTLGLDRGPAAYRQSTLYPTPGERWFDSDRSGFSFPRSKTFIERREGHPQVGSRMGDTEADDEFREERGALDFNNLLLGSWHEEDNYDDDEIGGAW